MKAKHTRRGQIRAIVPLNVPEKSKARLSTLLRPKQRAQLTIAMLADVLSALKKAQEINSITVVSADRNALGIARRLGADTLWEGKRRNLNTALRLGVGRSKQKSKSPVLIIHADLPLLASVDVDRFVARSRGYPVAIGPSKDGGTNALLLNPAEVIRPVFGRSSFKRHLFAADHRKLRYRVIDIPNIRFDLDYPRDLLEIRRRRVQKNTAQFLRNVRLHQVDPRRREDLHEGVAS